MNNSDITTFINLFLTDELFDMIAYQTNLYAHQYWVSHPMLPGHSRATKWVDITRQEMNFKSATF